MLKNSVFLRPWIAGLFLALLLLSGCEASACAGSGCAPSTTALKSLALGHDYKDGKLLDPADSFTTADTASPHQLHALAIADVATADTKVKAVWTAVNAANGAIKDHEIIDKEIMSEKPASGVDFHFSVSTDNGFPPGQYKIDVYLNDALAKSADFTITG